MLKSINWLVFNVQLQILHAYQDDQMLIMNHALYITDIYELNEQTIERQYLFHTNIKLELDVCLMAADFIILY